jgi:uncharacterized protein (TIGR02594 family)
VDVTAFKIAQRFMGLKETPGAMSTPLVLAMLKLDSKWIENDETAWCSAFVNFICHILELPRSRSLAARSWLNIGTSIPLSDAQVGFDIIVLKRGGGNQPGPEIIAAPGHVGFFAGIAKDPSYIMLLAGNQGDMVSIAPFPKSRILGIRRLV